MIRKWLGWLLVGVGISMFVQGVIWMAMERVQ